MSSIADKITSLPPLDTSAAEIQAICDNPKSSMSEMSRVIEKDPLLTANLLKVANSPLYGFSKEISSVSRAVSLFGMATIRSFVLMIAVKNSFELDLSPYRMKDIDFLRISTMQHSLTFNWYVRISPGDLNVLAPASFLMEVGKILIAHELISQQKEELFISELSQCADINDLAAIERAFIGMSSEEVGAQIFAKWNLEDTVVDSILYSLDVEKASRSIQKYASVLNVAKYAVNVLGQLKNQDIAVANTQAQKHGLNTSKLSLAIQKIVENI
ncbi:HDOD domain-containing protein [Campylobacter sp. MOP7]|uniref:HDOD domain-containing protein n=1 Tax=Campylobacter canis TaxID=3378588 RepID=UPI00387E3DB3